MHGVVETPGFEHEVGAVIGHFSEEKIGAMQVDLGINWLPAVTFRLTSCQIISTGVPHIIVNQQSGANYLQPKPERMLA